MSHGRGVSACVHPVGAEHISQQGMHPEPWGWSYTYRRREVLGE